MVLYECERCGYKVTHKHNFLKHLNRKKPCKPILSNIRFDSLKENFNKENHKMTPFDSKMTPIDSFNKYIFCL
jgi:hypothetical protein